MLAKLSETRNFVRPVYVCDVAGPRPD